MSTSPLRERAETILQMLVGRPGASLREDQWTAVHALVAQRRRALVVQRTGWGKSAVYFVATALLREGWGGWEPGTPPPRARAQGCPAHPGVGATVIISPLLALMRDQVAAAQRAGIRAATINSANATSWRQVEEQVASGEVDVLLVSPERLSNPVFREEVLPHLAGGTGLVVIDEAHCISDWGHDFRPDYRRIRSLLADLAPRTPVLATTATANERVTRDVAEQLGAGEDTSASRQPVLVLRGSLDRPSLYLGASRLEDDASRLAWLTSYLRTTPGCGIVYCLTVAAAVEVTEQLRQAGLKVAAYTGGTDPAERERLESDLKANQVKALVATSALGMGFDKPDLAFIVHLGAPSSPVAYYQQVGRGGRGVERAEVVLLPGKQDQAIWDWFGSQAFPPEQEVRQVLAALEEAHSQGHGPLSTAVLETSTSLRRTRLESMLKVLDVDGAVRRVRGGWVWTGRPWAYDAARYERVAAARAKEQDLMVVYEALQAPQCRMAFLRQTLDDPTLEPGWRCGRCDLCGGLSLAARAPEQEVEAARRAMAQVGTVIEPRRQWPTGMDRLGLAGLRGRITEEDRAGSGLAVGRLDGLGVSTTLRDLLDSATDGEVPPSLRPAVVDVAQRLGSLIESEDEDLAEGSVSPLMVVVIDSRTRPALVRQLGNAVARTLTAQPLGVVNVIGERARHDVGSAFRLAAVARSLTLQDWGRDTLARLHGARVVLVDDWTDSGWTLTVATRLLRQAGAVSVRPFVLAQR
ncbi:RecQ family ATP-dependent DNA helicase [Actinomyces faecalis]|uniref:RecQ family ATP-dependent DNA helicase n=1 Tax=Actinomyces faecalis TaxID=2722820 RepID=UPI00155252AB|nr:DEAD/DEAH box helicase [Actinomyces faecalis]